MTKLIGCNPGDICEAKACSDPRESESFLLTGLRRLVDGRVSDHVLPALVLGQGAHYVVAALGLTPAAARQRLFRARSVFERRWQTLASGHSPVTPRAEMALAAVARSSSQRAMSDAQSPSSSASERNSRRVRASQSGMAVRLTRTRMGGPGANRSRVNMNMSPPTTRANASLVVVLSRS